MYENPENQIVGTPEYIPQPDPVTTDTTLEPTSESLPLDEIKAQLLDPRMISKQHHHRHRNEIAETVSNYRELDQMLAAKKSVLPELTEQIKVLLEEHGTKKDELNERLQEKIVRLKNAVGMSDNLVTELQADIESIQTENEALVTMLRQIETELTELQIKQAELPEPSELLQAHYEKMSVTPLTQAEKRELLKPEVLAELSTEEYIALWRRLNPFFLSHVTRQGFRDHNAMFSHSGGLEEFHNGFIDVMEDAGLIRPKTVLNYNLYSRDEASVQAFINRWIHLAEDEGDAKLKLQRYLTHSWGQAPKYPDDSSIHFAAQDVDNVTYGAEEHNEVFFLYPSDFVAAQYVYAFGGAEKDLTQPQSDPMHNDIFVWPNSLDNTGIPVDAGLVFLPENTPVDPETGSRYASEVERTDGKEKLVMVENEELVNAFTKWATGDKEESPAIQIYKTYLNERDTKQRNILFNLCKETLTQEIVALGFNTEATDVLVTELIYDKLTQYVYGNNTWAIGSETEEEASKHILSGVNIHWKFAEKTVTAREYWENYFSQHPDQKPKHVVYYDGDPTTAIYEWQQKNGIGQADVSETEGELLGFEDNHVADMRKDHRAWTGYDALVEMSHKIIEEHFRRER